MPAITCDCLWAVVSVLIYVVAVAFTLALNAANHWGNQDQGGE